MSERPGVVGELTLAEAEALLERTGWTAPPKDGKEVETTGQPSSYVP